MVKNSPSGALSPDKGDKQESARNGNFEEPRDYNLRNDDESEPRNYNLRNDDKSEPSIQI